MTWETLRQIKRENREAEDIASARGPIACPRCGDVLRVRGNVRDCPTGDYTWSQ